MSKKCLVVGFKNDPKNIKVIRTTEDEADEIINEYGLTLFQIEEDYEYCEYITIEIYKYGNKFSLFVTQFEDITPAILNIDMRNETNFLYDIVNDEFIDFEISLWKNRDNAKNSEEATEYIASRLSELFNEINDEDADELTKYAEKFNVPLNLEMHKEFQKVFKTEHPNWDSSDGRCPW